MRTMHGMACVAGLVAAACLMAGCGPAGDERTGSNAARVGDGIDEGAFVALFDIAKAKRDAAEQDGRTYDSPDAFLDDVVKEAADRKVDLTADDVSALRSALSNEVAATPLDDVVGQFENLSRLESRGRTVGDILKAYEASVQEALAEMIGAGADQPLPSNQAPTPVLRQEVNYSCGDVATLSVLKYWKPTDFASTPEQDLYAPLQTSPEEGTEPDAIAAYINGIDGLHADYRTDVPIADLEAAIDHGQPPIVDIQAWQGDTGVANESAWATQWEDGHYVVLTGYDDTNFYFMDPSMDPLPDGTKRYAYIPRSEFVDRWHDSTRENQQIQRMTIFVSPTDSGLQPAPESGDATQASIMH